MVIVRQRRGTLSYTKVKLNQLDGFTEQLVEDVQTGEKEAQLEKGLADLK
jgi:hypothetical protein